MMLVSTMMNIEVLVQETVVTLVYDLPLSCELSDDPKTSGWL
jgi:hypothetical protein